MSLDGFIADEHGNFDWAAPEEEVHRFVNELERAVGTYLYGRRMYDTMVYWETEGDDSVSRATLRPSGGPPTRLSIRGRCNALRALAPGSSANSTPSRSAG